MSLSPPYSTAPTARGPLPRLAEPFASRARARRHARFVALVAPSLGMRIVDIGCGSLGLRGLAPELDITGVDLAPRIGYPGPLIVADASAGLPFADGDWEDVELLRRRELEALFGPAERERFGPFTKSWISVRPPARDR